MVYYRDLELYLEYFYGREDYFACQTEDGYRPANRALDVNIIDYHIKGYVTIAMYVLNKESKCSFICIDIDIPKDELGEVDFLDKNTKLVYLKDKFEHIKSTLIEKLQFDDSNLLFEDTGGRGLHIWFFFEEPLPGEKIVELNYVLKKYIDFPYEFFPKQPNLKGRKLGNVIKLPLGIHKKYENRSTFFRVLSDGTYQYANTIEDNIQILRGIKKVSKSFLEYLVESEHCAGINSPYAEEDMPLVSSRVYKKDLEALFYNCHALRTLNEKARQGNRLTHYELFCFSSALLSIEDCQDYLVETIKSSFGSEYRPPKTKKELEKIICFHPTSCKKMVNQGICEAYCTNSVKELNEDRLLKNTNPLSLYLETKVVPKQYNDEDLIERISDTNNIRMAYWKLQKYHKNEDALFYDEFDFKFFESNIDFNIQYISENFRNKSEIDFLGYEKVDIPKKLNEHMNMEYRTMSYASIYDQVVIQSIFNVISCNFEVSFNSCSYGYRANVNGASNSIFEDWRESYSDFRYEILRHIRNTDNKYYICCDIEKYYDNIVHDILYEKIKTCIQDETILNYLKEIIGMYEANGKNKIGLPQGPAYARVLANLYLNEFDIEINRIASGYARYVDDFFVFFNTEEKAKQGLALINELLSRLGLRLSQDEKKIATIKETIDDSTIMDKVDRLRYSLFEEVDYIKFLDFEKTRDFYDTFERTTIASLTDENITDINDEIPTVLYIIHKRDGFDHKIKEKFIFVIDYLVRNKRFYPKRLKSIFYGLIELLYQFDYNIKEFYQCLDNTHKIYFLLSLFANAKDNKTQTETLKEILDCNVNYDEFLKGFSFAIYHSLFPSFDTGLALKELPSARTLFLKAKIISTINFLKLSTESKKIVRDKIITNSSFLEKKYLLAGICSQPVDMIDEVYLRNIISDNSQPLFFECCNLFSKLRNNGELFRSILDILARNIVYKKLNMMVLTSCISVNVLLSESEPLQVLYSTIPDEEIKRETSLALSRNLIYYKTNDEFGKNYSLQKVIFDSCYYYRKNDDKGFAERIPFERLQLSSTPLQKFKNSVEELGYSKAILPCKVEVDTSSTFLCIKYDNLTDFGTMSYEDLRKKDTSFIFQVIDSIYKKARYYFTVLKRVPEITDDNILINKFSGEVIFVSTSPSLYPTTGFGKAYPTHDITSIPAMIGQFLEQVYFEGNKEKCKKYLDNPEMGLGLFTALLIGRMSSRYPFSYSKLNSLIKLIISNQKNNAALAKIYFFERIQALLSKNCRDGVNWLCVSNAFNDFFTDLVKVFGKQDLSHISYTNQLFLKKRYLHSLSKEILNAVQNIKNITHEEPTEQEIYLVIKLLAYYAVLSIEVISVLKSGFLQDKTIEENIACFDSKETMVVLEFESYQLDYNFEDIRRIKELIGIIKAKNKIFDSFLSFSLKQIAGAFILTSFKVSKIDNRFIIHDNFKDKYRSTLLIANFGAKLCAIEKELNDQIRGIILRYNQNSSSKLEVDSEIFKRLLSLFQDINKLRKRYGIQRYSGKIINTETLPTLVCCRSIFWRKFSASWHALYKMPLTNEYIYSKAKCSWDVYNGEMYNIAVPNEKILLLQKKVKSGKVFGWKGRYLYSGRKMLLFDAAIFCLLQISSVFFECILEKSGTVVNNLTSLAYPLYVKILYDLKHWFPRVAQLLKICGKF